MKKVLSLQEKQLINVSAISQIADKKEYRDAFKLINFEGGKAYITDGFMIAYTTAEVHTPVKKSAFPYQKTSKKQVMDVEGNIIDEYGNKLDVASSEIDYPEYSKILMEAYENKTYEIGFSIKVLEKMIKVYKKAGIDIIKVVFPESNVRPVFVKGTSGDIEMAVMPAKIGE